MPYSVRRKPKTPVGVRRSPSRLEGELPLPPSHAVQGPAVSRQQPPRFVHSRNTACVERRVRGTAVTSCVAEPVSRRFGSIGLQTAARSVPPEAEAATASAATGTTSRRMALQTTGDDRALARGARAAGAAALHALGRTGDGRPAPALVAPRLPGRPCAAAAAAGRLLGLRPPPARGRAGRERARGRPAHARLLTVVREALPDPAHAPDRRVWRQRRAFARGGQHRSLQLPVRDRVGAEAVVGARVRARDRRQPRREPVPPERPRPPARRPRLPRPHAPAAWNG